MTDRPINLFEQIEQLVNPEYDANAGREDDLLAAAEEGQPNQGYIYRPRKARF